jgi:hypothetical protein
VTAAEVAAALARLREAGAALRARPAAAVHAALAEVLDAWSAPGSAWQRELAAALPEASGLAPATVREGLARGLAPWTGSAFHALLRDEIGGAERLDAEGGPRAAGFDVTASVLAGAIPMPALLAILAPLALRSPVLVKPSVHDPVTAPLVARSIASRDPLLGACIEVADFRAEDLECTSALCSADCVVATGSDAAVAALAARARRWDAQAGWGHEGTARPRRFVGHGHRFSLALLGPEAARGAALDRAAADLALDVALWDQLGCLSLVSVHAIGADPRGADRVAEALAAALAALELRLPRGAADAAAGAAIARERAEAEMRAAAGRPVAVYAAPRGTAWTVVREADAPLRAAPLHRFVRVHPAPDLAAGLDALRPHAAHLAGVALAGFGAATGSLAAALADLGASRVCAPGALQAPPLAWRRDHLPVLLPLVRWTDLESC